MTVRVDVGIHHRYRFSGWAAIAAMLFLSSCSPLDSEISGNSRMPEKRVQALESPELSSELKKSEPERAADLQDLSQDSFRNTTLIPGDRVGSLTATTTYNDLVEQYGEESLESVEVHLGEGQFAPGTRVHQDDRSFSVVWTDEQRTAVQSVRDFGVAWQIEPGIGVGTSLIELREKLGEFELYGFGWDYGGTMDLAGTVLEPYQEVLVLRLSPTPAIPNSMNRYESVMGERLFPSDTPAFQDMNLAVREMIVILK